MKRYLFHCLILPHITTKVLAGPLFGTGEEATARRRIKKILVNNKESGESDK